MFLTLLNFKKKIGRFSAEQIEQGRVEEGSSNPGNAELTNGHLSSGDSIPNTPEADGFVWVPQSPKDDLSQA